MSNKKDNDKDQNKVIPLPTLKERERIAREKREAEAKEQAKQRAKTKKKSPWSVSYKSNQWRSGDGSPVTPNSRGNSGFRKQEPFFNAGNIPPFTKIMVMAFIAIHLVTTLILPKSMLWDIYQAFAFIPASFTGAAPMPSVLNILSPVTHMFLHSGWMHIVFNSLMMLVFGMAVEKRLGTKAVAFFFFAGGALGALAFLILHPSGDTQLLGASGGISALFGVILILMHSGGAQTSGLGFQLPFANKGPWPMIALWCLIMLVLGLIGGGNIAWQAHIAGFLSGAFLCRQMQKGNLRL